MPDLRQMGQQALNVLTLCLGGFLTKTSAGSIKSFKDLLCKAAFMQRILRPCGIPEMLHIICQQCNRQHQFVR
jgi:hypothetical protein